jgi:hypothetical protein
MHTMDEGNEEEDPVSTAWCKFHCLLPEWEGTLPFFLFGSVCLWISVTYGGFSGYVSRNLRMPLSAVFEISCIERSSSGASARLSWDGIEKNGLRGTP